MKIIGFLFLLCVSLVAGYAPLHVAENGELLDGSYIVIFNSDITEAQVASHMETLRYKIASSADNSSTVTHIYNIGSFRGYAAQLTPEILEHERDSEDVAYVEVDQIARIDYQSASASVCVCVCVRLRLCVCVLVCLCLCLCVCVGIQEASSESLLTARVPQSPERASLGR